MPVRHASPHTGRDRTYLRLRPCVQMEVKSSEVVYEF